MIFTDTLKIELNLVVQDETFSFSGGYIKSFHAELFSYGFRGSTEFWISSHYREDDLLAKFLLPDRIEARLSIEGVVDLPDPPPPPMVITGLVTSKAIAETSYHEVSGEPVLIRKYKIQFMDYASVLWKQHHPTLLYAETSMGEVIKQQLAEGISLEQSWGRLKSERPLICLGLGESRTSFYDFLLWYVDRFDGAFSLDYNENSYQLSSKKGGNGKVSSFRDIEIERFEVRLPETSRFSERVLNASTEASKKLDVQREYGVDGVFRDVLVRTPIASEVDDRKDLESRRLKTPDPELDLSYKRYPAAPFWPGTAVKLQEEYFSADLLPVGKTYRCYRVELGGRANPKEPATVLDSPHIKYDLEMSTAWEGDDDPVVKLPPFCDPRYPVLVEGKIICDMGEEGDRSYMTFKDDRTSQHFYKVHVPLWNRQIMVPFAPHFVPGHFYLPAYKDSRVLLALYFDHAEILRYLDWGADVQLPLESQGNHLLFGKNKTSETSAKHVYVDTKPVLSIQRICNGDIELLQIEDGTILLETTEDSALKEGEAKFDLSPKVTAARAKLSMDTKSSIAKISGGFESTSASLNTEIDGAVGQTKAALEGLEEEINSKVDQITGELEAAMAKVSQRMSALQAQTKKIHAELKEKLKL